MSRTVSWSIAQYNSIIEHHSLWQNSDGAYVIDDASVWFAAGHNNENDEPGGQARVGGAGRGARPQGRRNLHRRLAALQRARGQLYRVEDDEDEEASSSDDDDEPDSGVEEGTERKTVGKIGTKKLRRIQEKAERKQRREVRETHFIVSSLSQYPCVVL